MLTTIKQYDFSRGTDSWKSKLSRDGCFYVHDLSAVIKENYGGYPIQALILTNLINFEVQLDSCPSYKIKRKLEKGGFGQIGKLTKRPDMLSDLDPFGLETLMNHLQETTLNHM
ncbi:unnamed protein product [Lactuca virosa]|uniref:Uncharacterized protein n=1 Tax=Lactuca virosa TaxID=75947 RepID=A0AAU9LXL1_9ASTR|nr:unnamed protein product [Lactuca virosa]